MRYSRLVRLIARLFLLILASTMSLVSFLGGYSALLILSDEDNIDLDVAFEGDLTPANFQKFEVKIEFEVYNEGYFDLEDLEIELKLYMVYVNKSNDVLIGLEIYDGDKSFSTIPAGEKKKNKIVIDIEDLLEEVPDLAKRVLEADPAKELAFTAEDITIKAKYSLGLIAFKIKIDEMDLGDYDLP